MGLKTILDVEEEAHEKIEEEAPKDEAEIQVGMWSGGTRFVFCVLVLALAIVIEETVMFSDLWVKCF
ncbi:hypothetical protein JCGZ_22665 [Jatropha curcas]|uniref:Uncharacterized protein n=1 Tax=Jatropha curcas TaxID=180498 RepID=A0A067JYQ9_JATCU|nr:hypothetical protein JCGZ_22665 [Jatropha curcas]